MLKRLSLKRTMLLLVVGMVCIAVVPQVLYFAKTTQALARLGQDTAVASALEAQVQSTTGLTQQTALLALKRYRQIGALKNDIVRQTITVSMVYTALVTLGALFVGFLFITRITRPLSQLTKATAHLAHTGTLAETVPVEAAGEVGILAKAFTAMALDLARAREAQVMSERKATWERVARVIAHEIKNPLTPIRLSTERLYDRYQKGSPNFGEVLASTTQTILAEISNLQRLVDTFHAYAKFPDPVCNREDLTQVLRDAGAFFTFEGVDVVVNVPNTAIPIMIDKAQIREVLGNLIKNGAEAIKDTGHSGTVTIACEREKACARITVADTGGGIAPEHIDKLFMPYFTTKKGGNGIGLALSERIIGLHRGTITVLSTLGHGTIFTIVIPL